MVTDDNKGVSDSYGPWMLGERRTRYKPKETLQSKAKILPNLKYGSRFEALSSKEYSDDCWQATMETEQEDRHKKGKEIISPKNPEKAFINKFFVNSNNRKSQKGPQNKQVPIGKFNSDEQRSANLFVGRQMARTESTEDPTDDMGLDSSPTEVDQIKNGNLGHGQGIDDGVVKDLEPNGRDRVFGTTNQILSSIGALESRTPIGDGASNGTMQNSGLLSENFVRMEPYHPLSLSFKTVDVTVSNSEGDWIR